MTEATAAAPLAERANAHALRGLSAAGRALPAALLASLPGLVFLAGFDHLAYGSALLAGIVLAGLLIAPHVARAGAATISDALHRRFGRATSFAAAVIIVLSVLPILTAELALMGIVSEAGLGVPYVPAVLAAFAIGTVAAVFLDERAFGWVPIGALALFAASLLVPLLLMALKAGDVAPHLFYGHAVSAVGEMEEKLVENGLVDFDTFSVHTTPFIRLSGLDLVALVVSLALGTAVLPQLVSALAAGQAPASVRLSGAWAVLFAMLVLISVPALAAYAKLEIYGALTRETPLAALPGWLEAPLRAGVARIHGTSVYLLWSVSEAVRAGQADASAVSDFLTANALAAEQWRALDDGMREAVLASAHTLANDPQPATAWTVYLTELLPAAAAAAGNEAAMLTQAALVIEPLGLLLALPGVSGLPVWGMAVIVPGILAAALVMATALIRSLLSLGQAGNPQTAPARASLQTLALVLAAGAVAAGLAAARPGELVSIVVSALSLAAAGLFPVLAIGLAWKRATAAGAIAAIVLGGGVALHYDVGIQVFPAAFYRTWAPLSNAGDYAAEEFATLEAEVRDADGDEARAAAETALDTLARGTATRRGIANWFGIDNASGAIFGVPIGILALVLVSLLSRRRPL